MNCQYLQNDTSKVVTRSESFIRMSKKCHYFENTIKNRNHTEIKANCSKSTRCLLGGSRFDVMVKSKAILWHFKLPMAKRKSKISTKIIAIKYLLKRGM